MSTPIVSEPRPLMTFVDAPPVALICVGVVAGVLLVIVFVGISEVVRIERPARTRLRTAPRHRPSGGRPRVPHTKSAVSHPPKHTAAALAETQALPVHPSYLGPDVERAQPMPAVRREVVTTGGTR